MSGVSTGSRSKLPEHKQVLVHLRLMKGALVALVKVWDVTATVPAEPPAAPGTRRRRAVAEYPQSNPDTWMALWKAAVYLRDMADRIAIHAARQAQVSRQTRTPLPYSPLPTGDTPDE